MSSFAQLLEIIGNVLSHSLKNKYVVSTVVMVMMLLMLMLIIVEKNTHSILKYLTEKTSLFSKSRRFLRC